MLLEFSAKISLQTLCIIQHHKNHLSGRLILSSFSHYLAWKDYQYQLRYICIAESGKEFVIRLQHCKFGVQDDKEKKFLDLFYLINVVCQLIQRLERPVVRKFIHMRSFHVFFMLMLTAVHCLINRWTISNQLHSLGNGSWLIVLIFFVASVNSILNNRFKARAGSVLRKPKKPDIWKNRYYKNNHFLT